MIFKDMQIVRNLDFSRNRLERNIEIKNQKVQIIFNSFYEINKLINEKDKNNHRNST